jgi:hypothetical protein
MKKSFHGKRLKTYHLIINFFVVEKILILYLDPNPVLEINNQADTDSNMQIIENPTESGSATLPARCTSAQVLTEGSGGLPNYFTKPLVIHTYNSVLPAHEKNHLRELHYVHLRSCIFCTRRCGTNYERICF